jgi:hypothetical protein
MTTALDLIQAKNTAISGVGVAPALASYPSNGNIQDLTFPVVLTWLQQSTLDSAGVILRSTFSSYVYVAAPGNIVWKTAKSSCSTLWSAFLTAYNVTGDGAWLQNSPAIQIIRGSLSLSGFEKFIPAPDGEPFHGFIVTIQTTEHLG